MSEVKENKFLVWTVVGIVGVPSAAAIITLFILLDAWATRDLWNWFMVPILGLPVIGFAEAAGLSCAVGVFTQSGHRKNSGEKSKTPMQDLVTVAMKPVWFWIIGWTIQKYFLS